MLGRIDQRLSRYHLTFFLLMVCQPKLGHLNAGEVREPTILLGGYFEKPPVLRYLPGSQRTIVFPASVGTHGEIKPDTSPSGRSGDYWELLIRNFRERASLLMATIDPEMIRDNRGVIQMAVITGEDPMTASCILSPGFLSRFSAIFGPELIVAVPTRNRIYVFPKLANRIPGIARTIRDDYLASPCPVSCELFEISKKGLRTIGTTDPQP